MTELSYDDALASPPQEVSYEDAARPVQAAAPQPMTREAVQIHDAVAALSAQRARTPMQAISPMLDAFGHGFSEGINTGPTISQDAMKAVRDAKLFDKDSPYEAATETLAGTLAIPLSTAQMGFRYIGGAMRGAAAVAERAGLPRDVVGIIGGEFPVMPGEFGAHPVEPPVVRGAEVARETRAPLATYDEHQFNFQASGISPEPEASGPVTVDKTKFTNPGFGTKVLYVGDDAVARVQIRPSSDGQTATIGRIETLPSFQRNGYASQLMNALLDEFPDVKFFRSMQTEQGRALFESGFSEGSAGERIAKPDVPKVPEIERVPGPPDPSSIDDPTKPPPVIAEARDLGVIGPPKPDPAVGTPAEAAAAQVPGPRAAAAARAGDDVQRGPEPGAPEKAGNIRLDQIGINADAKDVILEAAKNNDDFNQARAGNVPLAQVESLSGASGVPSEVLSGNDGLGRLMHNDAVVRTWLQAFHQASDEIAAQLQTVARTGDEADITKLREMKLRFQHMQEQVSGLTAEAGRTLGVFREFYESKGKAEALGKLLEDNPGNDAGSLKKLADAAGTLDPRTQLPRFLHDANKPTFWDKYLYYWVNALISGPVTHIKYIGANAAFGAYEAGVVTPIAGALGAVRRGLGGEGGVYAGEAAARTWGLLAGTPDALKAAWTAARDNMMTPFPNEVAGAAVNPLTQTRPSPIGGRLGFAIGIPGRSAAGIHSFFRWLGYRAEIEAQAYRAAVKEGLSPLDGDGFWQRRAALADKPTDEMMAAGIENGNHLTFIGEQGTFGQAISRLANTRMGPGGMQPFKLILPFTHIPGQILRAGLEQTPAAFLDAKMRADLLGQNGAVAADTARARLVAGGVVGGMVANWALNDTLTGYGPTDQSERARWLRSHEPYSVRLGGWWYSYNKFGPIGDLMGLVANLTEVGPGVKDGDYATAAGHVIKATSHILEDEVGMQGLVNLIDALDDPDRKMARFVSGQAASNLPYSSLIRQSSSFNDPYMREAKTFVDQLRYSTPWSRQDLLPKRDWLGQPVENPGYQNIIRQRAVNTDPIDLEVAQLRGFKPAPPQARIGGVALPPKMYDEYQAVAGGMTRAALEHVVTNPNWQQLPPGIREQMVHSMVESMRKTAGAIVQARHPELILQGMQDRQDKIQGVKPTKLQE